MTTAPASRESFELALLNHLEESRRERISQFSPDMLAWLALPPQWTGRLARQAGFPSWDTAFLDAAAKEGLCARTRASLADQPPWYAAEVGARLAAYLPAGALTRLLQEVAAVDDQHARARILATMARSLPPSLLAQASQIAESLPDPGARTRALLGVSAAEPPAQAAATARLALSVAVQLADPGDRAETLLLVAGQGRLDDEARRELGQAILAALPALAYESERGSVLARAAPYLGPELVGQALGAALGLQAAECRIEALAGLTRPLPDGQAVALLQEQIAAITTITTEIGRRRAARTLARRLADYGAADLANSAALTLADEGGRESALQAVAGALASSGDSRQAAEATATVLAYGQDRLDQVSSLSTLARTVAGGDRSIGAEVAERARQAAATLTSSPANAQALVSLAAALVQTGQEAITVGERALESIAEISGADDRYQLYRRLCTEIPGPLASRAAELALAAAQNIASPADRVEALTELAAHLPPELRQTSVRDARALAVSETDFSFWMPEPARTEVLGELGLRHGPTFLHTQMIQIAAAVRTSSPDDPVSPAMARWAELASQGASDPAQAAVWLDRRLTGLTADGESGQALAWAGTGKLLVPVLGQELDSVVSVGLRRIELLYRRSLDLGHLRRFVARQEQIEEFWRLLDGDGTSWAVHYLGPGGLGKTMLLRQVTARLAPERGIPTARVDFDHLSPDYPIAKPGQLLLELLDELQSFVTSASADSFAYSCRAQVAQLHAPITQASNDPLARIHDEQFGEVLRTFCDFMLLLPQPVVLILDTCEELARRRAEGSGLPPVEATFEILERLHEQIPWLRVIFAGRRLLARSGPGWSVSPAADAEGHALLPERKDYLALHEMRGFSRDEVTGYLGGAAPGLPGGMTEAILARSSAPASAAPIVWEPPRPRDAEQRYNPFDVNLYANWVREDPSLRAETIAQGTTDPYIAIRIVRRLGQTDLDRLLPAVTLLGRFDRSMLRGELPGSDEQFENAYYELSSQEWIDYQPDASLSTTFLEVERNLRPRLRSYYRNDPDRYFLLREAQDRLGPALAHLVEDRPLNQIGVDLIDAAMRLLPPADAALLWDKVAGQIRAQGDWAWADQRTSRLLGADGAVADPGHPARAAVLASRISALIHTRSEYNPAPDWREVAERAAASPDPAVREWLRCRAIAGLVAAFRIRGVELSADDLAAFWELMDQFAVVSGRLPGPLAEQLTASCCAALEALVEVAEMRGDPSLVADISLIERWLGHIASQVPADLLALGTMIAARGQALHGRFETALELAAQAEESSADMPASRPGRWADFDAPSMVRDRIRLELVRMAAALPVPADPFRDTSLDDWQRSAEANLGTIDADRLLAAILLRRLSAGILPRDEVASLAALEEQATERVRRSPRSALWCHLAVPPLFTAVAWGWTALG
ncbi:MAG: ATP-binding protein, partial [Streptosporangiaceae bacterium]